ncbi:MAG TPA: tyrosine-type recombinase/integrase [Streptosporangiaceae bacterium]
MRHRRSGRVRGPLSPFAAGFRAELESRGYTPVSAEHRLSQFRQISRWLDAERLTPAEFTGEQAERFLAARRSAGLVTWVSPTCLAVPLGYLRDAGVTPAGPAVPASEPVGELLDAYREYLAGERGLVATTVARYARIARSFCRAVPPRPGGLGDLRAADVTAFLVAMSGQASPPSLSMTVTALASLLRYLHVTGVTAAPLARCLPAVARRRAGLPAAGLEASAVTRLLASCDRRRADGRRDYAIVLLLARLGLRAGEVAALRLDDADWYHGEIVVRGKADRHERLPLPADVGAAVAAYLRRGRPQAPASERALFLRLAAPSGPLTPGAVKMVVRHAAARAGLPAFGPHQLRHRAATATLRRGAPLPEVAGLLRHRTLAVTASYARVEPGALRELARPWPGGGA